VTPWRSHCHGYHPQRTTRAPVLARAGASGVLLAASEALACDNDLNNTVWADAHGLAPQPLACRKGRDLSALSQMAEVEDDGSV
jgi:hypothetical protein